MTLPTWWDNDRIRNNRQSARQERQHAAATGGQVQPGSGSGRYAKGDVRERERVSSVTQDLLTEMKFTAGKTFNLTVQIARKIMREALRTGREPQLIIDFTSHNVRAVVRFEEIP